MQQHVQHQHVEMIPLDRIEVLNPRERGRPQFRQLVRNVEMVGLKRPITVSRQRLPDGGERYALVCGQGRLEIYRALGQTEIPAFVTEAPDEECLVMSLVENVARRRHTSSEMVREIGSLRARGLTSMQISERIGMTRPWVNMVLALLDNGERHLLEGVDKGLIPVSWAISVSRSGESEVQQLLVQAYEEGKVRGHKLRLVRRLLARRASRLQAEGAKRMQMTPAQLEALYQQEVERQNMLAKTVAYTHEVLAFVRQALSELLGDDEFTQLLLCEGVALPPSALDIGLCGEQRQ